MNETALEQVQELIRNLSAEDRQSLVPFLASLPESGLESYDLSEEIEIINKANPIRLGHSRAEYLP